MIGLFWVRREPCPKRIELAKAGLLFRDAPQEENIDDEVYLDFRLHYSLKGIGEEFIFHEMFA
jgi:hypothetical protein